MRCTFDALERGSAGSSGQLSQQDGHHLEQSVQAILDDYRSQHVTAAKKRYAWSWSLCIACDSIKGLLT